MQHIMFFCCPAGRTRARGVGTARMYPTAAKKNSDGVQNISALPLNLPCTPPPPVLLRAVAP
eukprot:scaffold22691_cov101-Isochrysis_galbana.AAC.6